MGGWPGFGYRGLLAAFVWLTGVLWLAGCTMPAGRFVWAGWTVAGLVARARRHAERAPWLLAVLLAVAATGALWWAVSASASPLARGFLSFLAPVFFGALAGAVGAFIASTPARPWPR
jgi:cytochrome bd-type quinol oxidase subunit 2